MVEQFLIKVDKFGKDFLINVVKIFMSFKIFGVDDDFFVFFVVDVMFVVKIINVKGEKKYFVKVVNVFKVYGKFVRESFMVKGYVLNCIVVFYGMLMFIFLLGFS